MQRATRRYAVQPRTDGEAVWASPSVFGCLEGSVRFTSAVSERFEAAHHVLGHSTCGGNHGHAWEVEVRVEGGLDPKKVYVVDHGELAEALRAVVDEIRGRDLNDMLPGVVPTPEGLGLYIRERLILDWPRIVGVSVSMGPQVRVWLDGDIR